MGQRIFLTKQFVYLLSGDPNCSLHKGSVLQAVLSSDENNSMLITVKSLYGIPNLQYLVECSEPRK